MSNEPVEFEFHSVGATSGETYKGTFAAKPILTFRERALADADKRNFMGNPVNEVQVNELVANVAIMISQIRYRTTKRPQWAEDLASLVDENVLMDLFSKCMDVEKQYREKLAQSAEEAKKALLKS